MERSRRQPDASRTSDREAALHSERLSATSPAQCDAMAARVESVGASPNTARGPQAAGGHRVWFRQHPYLLTIVACGAANSALLTTRPHLDVVAIALLQVLVVALVAFQLGRGPALLASAIQVLVFDLGFIPPQGSLTVHDPQHLVVFGVMLCVAMIISHISGDLLRRRQMAVESEARQRALYELAAALNSTLQRDQVIAIVTVFLRDQMDAEAQFHAIDVHDAAMLDSADEAVVAVLSSGETQQRWSGPSPRPCRIYRALRGATRLRGVLQIDVSPGDESIMSARADLLSTLTELTAAALERLHYLDVAARVQSEIEAERLRNSLLATLSHDLRTPLTVLYAQADTLRDLSTESCAVREQAAVVCDEALRANRLCESLLDLAQVRSSRSILRREWVTLEEIVGAALRSLAGVAGSQTVVLQCPVDLPWLQLDVRMFERVIANLLDNALKQGGTQQRVCIAADHDAEVVRLRVSNSGSRFPEHAEHLLSAFARGERSDANAGFGIGLATCHAVVVAHGGSLTLRNRNAAAEVEISLPRPLEPMPSLPAGSPHA